MSDNSAAAYVRTAYTRAYTPTADNFDVNSAPHLRDVRGICPLPIKYYIFRLRVKALHSKRKLRARRYSVI